jgi:hypothetical protein
MATSWLGKNYMDRAARKGHTSIVLWLHDHLNIRYRKRTVRWAALGGHQHTIDGMRASGRLPVDESCLVAALIVGQGLVLARSICRAGQSWTLMARVAAVALGDPSIVAQLNDQRRRRLGNDLAVTVAVACDQQDMLRAMRATPTEIAHARQVISHQKEWHDTPFDQRVLLDCITREGMRGRDLAMEILRRFDFGWRMGPRPDDRCVDIYDGEWLLVRKCKRLPRLRPSPPPPRKMSESLSATPPPLPPRDTTETLLAPPLPPGRVAQRAMAHRIQRKARDDERRFRPMFGVTRHHG